MVDTGANNKVKKDKKRKTTSSDADAAEDKKAAKKKKSKKNSNKESKDELMSKVPTHNEDGIAYTKIQIRKMYKRVKKGLNPIMTEEELEESERLKKEEEREVREMMFDQGGGEDDEQEDDEEEEEENTTQQQNKKKKDVPGDYVCAACGAKGEHLIYDCLQKVSKKTKNANPRANDTTRKSTVQGNDGKKQVFVSGLPFHMRHKDIMEYFESKCAGAKITKCRLLTFKDSGKCKGQAYLTFETAEGCIKALGLDGASIDQQQQQSDNGGNDDEKKKKKILKLQVVPVAKRNVAKNNKKKNHHT